MHPNTGGILESSLYVTDVVRSAQFYEKIFGFQIISDFGERGCAICGAATMFLVCSLRGTCSETTSS